MRAKEMIKDQQATEGLKCQIEDGARFVVVGLGGIGTALVHPLAMFLHSMGGSYRLVLVDGDKYEPENAQRQMFRNLGNKADVKAKEVLDLLGPTNLTVVSIPEFLQPENISKLLKPGDYSFVCVDNHPTRKLVSQRWQQLSDATLISGGNEGVNPPKELGTYGNVQVALRRGGEDHTVPITRYHPEITATKEKLPHELSCGELVKSTPQILFTNMAVASAMLNAFFAVVCDRLDYQEVKLDILEARMLPQFPIKP